MLLVRKSAVFTLLAVALGLFFVPFEGVCCTSWMVFSDLTGNGTNILHKNRDSASRKVFISSSEPGAKLKWISLGSGGANIGFNSSGLAGCMNSGEKCSDPPSVEGKKSTPKMLQVILAECNSAAQAVAKLRQFVKDGDYSHRQRGSIFLFMDSREGYICEITAKVCTAQHFNSNYTVRASVWHNPLMYQYSREEFEIYLKASSRAYIAISGLNRMLDETGKITLPGIFEHSRHHIPPKKSPFNRSICGKTTNSAASIEIDKEYPQVLSTMYAAIGHPRHTVYVPIPIVTEYIPPIMKNRKWSMTAYKRLDELDLNSPIPEEWTKFEKESMASYTKAKAYARKLLAAGKSAEAAALLNFTAKKIWKKAAVMLNIVK